jgi:hypothetical protein
LALVLSLFIPVGFILLALRINYFSVESAYGQEFVETTIKPNTGSNLFHCSGTVKRTTST